MRKLSSSGSLLPWIQELHQMVCGMSSGMASRRPCLEHPQDLRRTQVCSKS
jgi:hypothetical protein